ncbi:hypothetical protein [Nitratireductor soli]|uniref:hypothetical protein n=1 Tax=Nitratireductor soli TaxID=1670619 RepID=UPI00065E6301|nr:hypothetical protein [Nitratireductor soli]
MIASFLLLAWVIPEATPIQLGLGHVAGQSSLAATQPIEHPTIVVRDLARHSGAEASRLKTGAYAPVADGDGKPLGIVPDVHLPLEAASGILFAVWPDDRSKLPPIRAFDARGPPTRAA